MTYYTAKDLADAFRTVRKNTIQVAEDIPEAQYGYRAAAETRSVAETLVHVDLALQMARQIHEVEHRSDMTGFDFPSWIQRSKAEEAKNRSKAEIIAMLKEQGEKWSGWLESLSEATLS